MSIMTHEFNDGPPERIQNLNQIDMSLLKQGTIRLEKSSRVPSPEDWGYNLEPDYVSIPKNANKVYRDQKTGNSIQVREYDEYYLIQLDHANPSEGGLDNVVAHYKMDISPGQKAAIGGIAIVALWLLFRG